MCGECAASRGREAARPPRAPWRRDQHRRQKRGDGIGYSGHKHQKGEKIIAIIDNHGYVLAPVPVAPVNETDMVLLPDGLKALKRVDKNASSTKPSMRCGCGPSGSLRGKISSSGCYSDSNASNSDTIG